MAERRLNAVLFAARFELRGTSAYTLRLAENLKAHDVGARVVCGDAKIVRSERRAKLPLSEYPHIGVPLWGRVVRELMRRELAESPPDLIHIQSWGAYPHGSWLAGKLNRPFVLTAHDYLPARRRVRVDTRLCRRIVAVSDSVRTELLARVNLPEDRVCVIHTGVEPAQNVTLLPVLDPGHVPVIGTAGPLEAVKGLPFFLGAAQRVLAAHSEPVQFLISGAGPEEGNLRRLARELGIAEQVTFIPNLPEFSVALAAMDIFCLPSLRQGLGTIMLEAMSMGKPVIASGVGGVYSAVRDNETGLVVPPSNSSRLADRMLELLRDPVQARAIGESGRQLVLREFGVDKMVRQTAELYRDVVAETASPTVAAVAAKN